MRDALTDLAISPIDEAFKAVVGAPSGDGGSVPDPVNRTLYLGHEIDEFISAAFSASIHTLSITDAPIFVVFNTPGGVTLDGLAIYDAITAAQTAGAPVIGTVRGCAMSMGIVILQACAQRRMSANSYIMIHDGWGETDGTVTQAEADIAWWREMENRCNRLTAARSTLTPKEIEERIKGKNWYLNAKQAYRYAFVDEVV